MWLWPLKMPTQNSLMLLVLLMLMLWNVLTTTPGRYVLFSLRLRSIDICFFYSRSINFFGLKWPLSRVLFLDNSFSGKFFDDPFCKGFFSDELFLNKGRKESGAPYLLKMCVFGLKTTFSGRFDIQYFSRLWKVWELAFRSIRQLMFSALLTTVWSRFWSWSLPKILSLVFGRDIEAEVLSRFWCIFLV